MTIPSTTPHIHLPGRTTKPVGFYKRYKHRLDGLLLLAAGIAVVVWEGYRTSQSTSHPSAGEISLLLLVAVVLQVAAGVTFGRVGRVDPQKAKGAVRNLLSLGYVTRDLREALTAAEALNDAVSNRHAVSICNQGLRQMAYGITNAIQDWSDVYEEALTEVLSDASAQQLLSGGQTP